MKWHEYVLLFGAGESRIDVLNKTAPSFFRLIHDSLFEDVLLNIARLTDAERVGSSGGRETLTLQRLPSLVNPAIRAEVQTQLTALMTKTKFARDWRHRLLAHRDLRLALDEGATPLTPANRREVRESLEAVANLLNAVETYYGGPPVAYDVM